MNILKLSGVAYDNAIANVKDKMCILLDVNVDMVDDKLIEKFAFHCCMMFDKDGNFAM